MKRKIFLSLTSCLLISLALLLHATPAYASFNANDLIDDTVFDNSSSMSANQIDSWLNANFPQSCISTNNGFSSPDPTGYNPTDGFIYGGNVSGGRVIADAAQAYDINPQVLIATLEKESSVVTGAAPYHCQYINTAMGFDCPDSGSCPQNPATESGFSKQVIHAAWLLKFAEQRSKGNVGFNIQKPGWDNSDDIDTPYNGPMTQGTHQRISSGPSAYYDGYTTIDGTSVHMDTGGTASSYNYTPHFHGNQLFVSIFEQWFGSTTGELVRTTTSSQVYITNSDNGYKYPINSQALYNDMARLGLRYVTSSYLNGFTTGNQATGMVKGPGSTLYLVNASIKLAFTSCSGDIVDYGYTCSVGQYIILTQGQLNKLVTGPNVTKLMKAKGSNSIYYMSAGKKRPFTTFQDLKSLHIPLAINTFTTSLVGRYPTGAILYGYGSLVKTADSNTVYAAKDTTHLMTVSNFGYPRDLGLSTGVRTMSNTDFQQTYGSATGASGLTNKVTCNSINYVGTSGLPLYTVSAGMATNYGYDNSDFVDVGNICLMLNVNSQSLSQYIRDPNGTIYYVSSGQKRAFTSYSAFQSASYCNNTCTYNQVSSFFANSIPSGANISN